MGNDQHWKELKQDTANVCSSDPNFMEQLKPTFAPRDLDRKDLNHEREHKHGYVEMTRK